MTGWYDSYPPPSETAQHPVPTREGVSLLTLLVCEHRLAYDYARNAVEDFAGRLEDSLLASHPCNSIASQVVARRGLPLLPATWSPYICSAATALSWLDAYGDPLARHGFTFQEPKDSGPAPAKRRQLTGSFYFLRPKNGETLRWYMAAMHRQVLGAEMATVLKQMHYLRGLGLVTQEGTIRRCHPAAVPEWIWWTQT